MTPLYSCGTWGTDLQAYTPQAGAGPAINVTLWQLRAALKQLRRMGYECWRRKHDGSSDPSVLVERTDGKPEAEILKGWER